MNIKLKLKIMMFLQYFTWGCWLITFGAYMINELHFSGVEVGSVYSTMGIASLIMPSLLGIIADRWVPANRLYMICHLVGAAALFFAASVTTPLMMTLVMLINSLAYMPTIALSNSVSYYALESKKYEVVSAFPPIRVFGTVGFIIAMWSVSLLKLELSSAQLYIASISSILLCLCALSLPKMPVDSSESAINATESEQNATESEQNENQPKEKRTLASLLGLQAFVLLKEPRMAVFFLFSLFLGAVLQITNTFGSPFLHDFAMIPEFKDSFVVQYPSILLSVSQISEVVFILFVPFFLKRLGIKYVMIISMFAWALRYALFAYGDPSPIGFWLLFASMIVYGCAFDFYNISGSIYVDKTVEPKIRNSAQGLFMTMTNGLGAYFGSITSGLVVDAFTTNGVKDWQSIWLVFAGYSIALAAIFIVTFKNKKNEFDIN